MRDTFALPLERTQNNTLAFGYTQSIGKHETRIDGYVDGVEAYRQFVHHCCHTERGTVPCVDDNEGVELEQFIGKPFGFLKSRVERVIRTGLMMDERTVSVNMTSCILTSLGQAEVSFDIDSTEGRIEYGFIIPL